MMNRDTRAIPSLPLEHFENQKKIDPEMLLPYMGQYVAWSWDGSRIVDSDPVPEELDRKLLAAGVDLERVVFEYLAPA